VQFVKQKKQFYAAQRNKILKKGRVKEYQISLPGVLLFTFVEGIRVTWQVQQGNL
jgi:hypothetical protein